MFHIFANICVVWLNTLAKVFEKYVTPKDIHRY